MSNFIYAFAWNIHMTHPLNSWTVFVFNLPSQIDLFTCFLKENHFLFFRNAPLFVALKGLKYSANEVIFKNLNGVFHHEYRESYRFHMKLNLCFFPNNVWVWVIAQNDTEKLHPHRRTNTPNHTHKHRRWSHLAFHVLVETLVFSEAIGCLWSHWWSRETHTHIIIISMSAIVKLTHIICDCHHGNPRVLYCVRLNNNETYIPNITTTACTKKQKISDFRHQAKVKKLLCFHFYIPVNFGNKDSVTFF